MTPPDHRMRAAHHRHRRSIQLREDRAGQTACPEAARDLHRLSRFLLLRHGRNPARRAQEGELRPSRLLDWPLLHRHLQDIAAGRPFDEPVYSFAHYARTTQTRRITPGDFVIVEGLFVLYWSDLRAMLDTKVYRRRPIPAYASIAA